MKSINISSLKRLMAFALVCVMLLGIFPVGLATNAAYEDGSTPVTDMKVAKSIYGWVTTAASKVTDNENTYVTVGIVPAGETDEVTYTTAVSYGECNAMTDTDEADVIVSRCGVGIFAEICLNADDEVIDMRRVLQSGLFFDTAEYGGELTAADSEVKYRGVDFVDSKHDNKTGGTGVMTGLSGNMVASGWILDKGADDKTVTIGDGNQVAVMFNEEYNVADDVEVYTVDNKAHPKLDENNNEVKDDRGNTVYEYKFVSTISSFADMDVTPETNGNIYGAASNDRHMAVVVFDGDYTKFGEAKVTEIYVYEDCANIDGFVGKIPQSIPVSSDYSKDTQGTPKPNSAPYLTATNPITVVDGKMWTVGDIEVNNYLFKGAKDKVGDGNQLVMFDFGWTKTGYQYWKSVEIVGEDPRDLDKLLVSHGHGDHYGDAFDAWEMIVRADGKCEIYETYEDTMGYDIYGFPEIKGMFSDAPFRSIVTTWYDMDNWLDLGDGLKMYPTLTPGHTQGVASAIFEVTVGDGGMPEAKLNSEKNEDGIWEQTYSDYVEGDEIFFVYMGGYGINGLQDPERAGFKRNAFVASLRHLQSVIPNLDSSSEKTAAGIYNLPQHTNQFPYLETYQLSQEVNKENNTKYPFLHFLREGQDEVINFCEKRASAILYSDYAEKYFADREAAGGNPTYLYEGQEYEVSVTSTSIKGKTLEDKGPFKHEGGETVIQISDDVEILVMHGYDPFLNKGVVAADTYETTKGYDINKGFVIAKDCYVQDPNLWYVQIGAHVQDDYTGAVYGTIVDGKESFPSGPVESFHGEGWSEIIRTGGMEKADAEALADSLVKGEFYTVNMKKTGDIINNADVLKTFAPYEMTSVYGFMTEDLTINEAEGGYTFKASMIPAGSTTAKIYTSDVVLTDYNELTDTYYAEMLAVECTKGTFCEILYNSNGDIVDIHQVLDANKFGELNSRGQLVYLVGFDTAQYGGDLTAADGTSGRMVSNGWIYGMNADNTEITVGDGNHATNVFDEKYKVTDQTKVFLVDADYKSTESDLATVKASYVTQLDANGEIYLTEDRYVVTCVFADDYTVDYDQSVVEELYVYSTTFKQHEDYRYTPDDAPNHSDYRENNDALNKDHMPQGHPEMTSANPFCLVKDRLYWIGDDEVTSLLMVADNGDLTVMDLGWPNSGYQYMKNIEKLGFDPRDVKTLALTHGHVDHYGTANDFTDMNNRAGVDVKVYESKEDTLGYGDEFKDDNGNPWTIAGALSDKTARYVITDFFPEHEWFDIDSVGDIEMYSYINNGHSTGALSFIISVIATDHDEYFEDGEKIQFSYMGGYGSVTSLSRGYLRNQFQYSLQYLQSYIVPMMEKAADDPSHIYCIPQHTNHYPIIEVSKAYNAINAGKVAGDAGYVPLMECMTGGADVIINQLEKRFASSVYESYFQAWLADTREIEFATDPLSGKVTGSSKTNQTNQKFGPFKREAGEYDIEILSDTTSETGIIMHGYNAWQNPNVLFDGLVNIDGEDLSKGFVIEKDSYVHDPDGWYVQICVHVDDDYTGNIQPGDYDTVKDGKPTVAQYAGGPVESLQGKGWFEVIRSERLDSKADAEALLATLETNGIYSVKLDKSSEIKLADILGETFTPLADGQIVEMGGLQTLPATGSSPEAQQPFHDALKNDEGKLEDYYKVVYAGYFDLPMVLNADSNTKAPGDEMICDLRMYIPSDSRYSQPSIYLMVPSGMDPYEFMVESGWKETADANNATVFLLMPPRVKNAEGVATAWGSWGSYTDAEVMAYIAGAIDVSGQRPGIQTVSYCFYGVGYGDAADYMTEYVMQNPTKLAGAFAVGSTGDVGTLIADMQAKDSAEADVKVSEIAIPFGIVAESSNDNVTALVEYFKTANQTVSTAATNGDFTYYAPDADADTRQPDSEPVAGVYYQTETVENCMNAEFTQSLFDIFNTARRYPGYQNTELRGYDDVYKSDNYKYYTSLTALGDYTYGGDIAAAGDGEYYNREWWVYVSDAAQARIDNGEKVETLFLFMGSNGYGDEVPQRTGWDHVADEEGFIIVSPSGHVRHKGNFGNYDRNGVNVYQYCTNWNANDATSVIPNDLLMIDDIYKWLFETEDSEFYGMVDSSKVYASGQSAGGNFAHQVAQHRPAYFAASAPSSWVDAGTDADTSSDVAMVVLMGQKDTTIRGALSTSNAQKMFDNYIARYGNLSDKEGRDSWSDFTFMQEANGTGTSTCTESVDGFNKYILETDDGVPMFVGLEVVGLTHATVPTQCLFAWDIMSHFSKDDAGILYYDGDVVDAPVSEKLATVVAGGGTSKPSVNPNPDTDPDKPVTDGFPFVDSKTHWAKDAIEFVYDEGIMNGTSATTFAPNADTTRGMIVTMLYRLAGSPKTTADNNFTDVKSSAYYYDAVIWAAANGIVKGVSETSYAPDTSITREQLALMLHNYTKFAKYDATGSAALDGFSDSDKVSSWALDGLKWAVSEKLVTGVTDTTLVPTGTATRAQVATMFQRFMENIVK